MTNSINFAEMGETAASGAFRPVLDWMDSFFSGLAGEGMPGDIVVLIIGFIGSFAVLWALWYGFKALRKAFSKANF